MRKQVGRVVAAVAVISALLSGCGGPSQAGAAVIVGTVGVPIERVQAQLDVALGKTDQLAQLTAQGGGPVDLARGIVTREVIHELLTRRTAAEGIVVTDAQVEAELAANGGADAIIASSLYGPDTLRERVRDDLAAAELARRSVAGLAVTADLAAADSREEAEGKARVLAAGGPGTDALLADQQTAAKGMTYQAATQPDAAATVLFGTPVGGVVAFQPNPQQSTWIVFRITDRRTDMPSDPAALDSISRGQLTAIGERMLQIGGDDPDIRVNPRYGVWDRIQQSVVDPALQTGLVLPPGPAAG